MFKVHTTLSVDNEILEKAKQSGLNISELLEKTLLQKAGIKEVQVQESNTCEFCGKAEQKATRDNLIGLIWLYPQEQWICNFCLQEKIKRIAAN